MRRAVVHCVLPLLLLRLLTRCPPRCADPYTLFVSELVLMGFAETRRLQDYRKPGSQNKQFFLGMEAAFGGSGNPAYPGGQFFNLAGLGVRGVGCVAALAALPALHAS